jgi:hypothetical protein
MWDAVFMLVLAGFAALTWGLIVLCDRVKGGGP